LRLIKIAFGLDAENAFRSWEGGENCAFYAIRGCIFIFSAADLYARETRRLCALGTAIRLRLERKKNAEKCDFEYLASQSLKA
jgi:hypothetical protein